MNNNWYDKFKELSEKVILKADVTSEMMQPSSGTIIVATICQTNIADLGNKMEGRDINVIFVDEIEYPSEKEIQYNGIPIHIPLHMWKEPPQLERFYNENPRSKKRKRPKPK